MSTHENILFSICEKCIIEIAVSLDGAPVLLIEVAVMEGNCLSEMTLEQLWELFPIFLTGHKNAWKDDYDRMEAVLQTALSTYPVHRISHIGSTAIDGIWAKPIIDILVEIDPDANMSTAAKAIEGLGFLRMSSDTNRISFNYGYTADGFAEKVYHLHLRYTGDNCELYFRDYMNSHPDIAEEYEKLKLQLWKKYVNNRDAYTDAKAGFVEKYTALAKKEYGKRYINN